MNAADKLITQHLAPFMEARGLKYRQSQVGFVQKRSFGFFRLACHSTWLDYLDGFKLQVGLSVRHDCVDEIVNKLGHIWGANNQKQTTTIYRGLGFFPFDEHLSDDLIRRDSLAADAASVSDRIEAMMGDNGDAFFERYASLLECSRGLNEPIETHTHPLCNGYPLRAYYGITAAGLSEPARVPELIEAYSEFCRKHGWVDPAVYDVGNGLPPPDAIKLRFCTVAQMAADELRFRS